MPTIPAALAVPVSAPTAPGAETLPDVQSQAGGLDFQAVLAAQLGMTSSAGAAVPSADPEALSASEHEAQDDESATVAITPGELAQWAPALPLALSAPINPLPSAASMPDTAAQAVPGRLGAGIAPLVRGQVDADVPAALPQQPAVIAAAPDAIATNAQPLAADTARVPFAVGTADLPLAEASEQPAGPDFVTHLGAPEALREAARPPAAAALHASAVPVHSARFADEVGNRIVWMASQGQQIAELRLDPPHLGPLEVRLSLSGEQATLTLLSAQPAVRDALQAGLPRLQEMMHGAGIDLGGVFVGAQNSGQHPGERAPGQGAPGLVGMPQAEIAAVTTGAGFIRIGRGAVDVYA